MHSSARRLLLPVVKAGVSLTLLWKITDAIKRHMTTGVDYTATDLQPAFNSVIPHNRGL